MGWMAQIKDSGTQRTVSGCIPVGLLTMWRKTLMYMSKGRTQIFLGKWHRVSDARTAEASTYVA